MLAAAAGILLALAARASAELVELPGSPGEAKAAAFSRDGRKLAVGGDDRVIRVWNLESRRVEISLEGHKAAVSALAFSPDGNFILSGSADGELRFWNPPRADAPFAQKLHKDAVLAAAFTADGRRQATAGTDGTVRTWDILAGQSLQSWQAVPSPAAAASLSGDGSTAFFAGREDGKSLLRWIEIGPGGTGSYNYGAKRYTQGVLSGHGGVFLFADGSSSIRVEARKGSTGFPKELSSGFPPAAAALSFDGNLAAAADSGGKVALWDAASGKRLYLWEDGGPVSALLFDPSGTRILAAGADGILRLRDIPSEAEMKSQLEEFAKVALAERETLEASESSGADEPVKTGCSPIALLAATGLIMAAALFGAFHLSRVLFAILLVPAGFLALGLFSLFFFWNSPGALSVGESDIRIGLGPIRSALSIYYGDTNGNYPANLRRLTRDGKYLREIPLLWSVYADHALPPRRPDVPHPLTRKVAHYPSFTPRDSGRWGYVDDPKDANFGTVFIDCTHTDSRGSAWTSY
jgi:hypothetical protein